MMCNKLSESSKDILAGLRGLTWKSEIPHPCENCLTLESAVQRQGELIDKLEKALKSLNNSMPEGEIDLCRDSMGNTNVNVILHWKGEAVKVLAVVSEWRKEQMK